MNRRDSAQSRWTRSITVIAAAALAFAGCSASAGENQGSTQTGAEVAVRDAWAKAADAGMTSAFASVENRGTADAELTGASSDAAGSVELHETVTDTAGQGTMRPTDGLLVPAGGVLELAPGGAHLMLMDLTGPLAPGDMVDIRLQFADGTTLDAAFAVKDYAGAEENYQP